MSLSYQRLKKLGTWADLLSSAVFLTRKNMVPECVKIGQEKEKIQEIPEKRQMVGRVPNHVHT
jgi:hypothetical protein